MTGSAIAAVLPSQRVNVGATTKQIEEEADLQSLGTDLDIDR